MHELPTIIALAPSGHNASNDTGLRKATGRFKMGRCHHVDLLHEHVFTPSSFNQPALYPPWLRVIGVSENLH